MEGNSFCTDLRIRKEIPAFAIVFAKGSNPIRTRLYQMGICSHINEINKLLYVYGSLNGKWERFRKDVNYEAFLVMRK